MLQDNPIVSIDQSNADEAFERVLPEAMGLDPDSLAFINLDVPTCVITAMGVLEKIPSLQQRIYELPHSPKERFAKLPDYVLALFRAQTRYTFAVTPPEPLPELLEEAASKRDVLIAEAKALVARGLLQGDLLKELTGTHGYKNVAFDLSGLTEMFKAMWASLQGRTGLQLSDIENADKLSLRLAAAVAHRESSPEAVAAATEVRQRIFTLFCDTYDQLRRAVTYLRWDEGDADEIVPSLYAGRPNSNAKPKPAAAPANQTTTSTTQTTPSATPAVQAVVAGTAPGANKVPVGFPGSDPLTSS